MQARLLGAAHAQSSALNQVTYPQAHGPGPGPGPGLFAYSQCNQSLPAALFAHSTHSQSHSLIQNQNQMGVGVGALGSPPPPPVFVPPDAYRPPAPATANSRPHALLRQQSAVEMLADEQRGGAPVLLRNAHRLSTPTASQIVSPLLPQPPLFAAASAVAPVADPSRDRLVQLQSTLRQQHTRLSQLLQSLSPGPSQQSLVDGRVRLTPRELDQTLSRQQLRINAAEFVLRSSDRLSHSRASHGHTSGLEGQLLVRVYCGRGLQTQAAGGGLPAGLGLGMGSPTAASVNERLGGAFAGSGSLIKDLYCVLELDNVRRARSWIRTGIDEFEWDEAFELELENSRLLSLLIFHWEPSRAQHEHVLHFYGNLSLLHFLHEMQLKTPAQQVRDSSSYKLALKLEPRGLLYLELAYRSIFSVLARVPRALPSTSGSGSGSSSASTSRSFPVFGVRLELVLEREQARLEALLLAADGTGAPPALLEQLRRQRVPIVLKRAVDEIERRGLDVPGIYRHACSLRPKQQLRERLELEDPLGADLSADAVPDVHVIAGTSRCVAFRSVPVLFCLAPMLFIRVFD